MLRHKAFFFDMDGTLFDSMPHHALAWETVMSRHGFSFSREDCYINEGRTGQDVITEALLKTGMPEQKITDELVRAIYKEKTDLFHSMGEVKPIAGVPELLCYLKAQGASLWIVTGSGQQTLFDTLEQHFPGIFARERMITAFDVEHGKPHPEPYLKAWEHSGFGKEDCCVVENAPLGIRSAKAAGLYAVGINTGPLQNEVLRAAGADQVFHNMADFQAWLESGKP